MSERHPRPTWMRSETDALNAAVERHAPLPARPPTKPPAIDVGVLPPTVVRAPSSASQAPPYPLTAPQVLMPEFSPGTQAIQPTTTASPTFGGLIRQQPNVVGDVLSYVQSVPSLKRP